MTNFKPLRSVLYMPASNTRAMDKAQTLPADAVILDLEDGVAVDSKQAARVHAVDAVKGGAFGYRHTVIRVNAIGSKWYAEDVAAVAASDADAVLLPKVNSAKDVQTICADLAAAGAKETLALWLMIETPAAIFALNDIAVANPRTTCLVVGGNDLIKDLHALHTPCRSALITALNMSVMAARAHGLSVIDVVYNGLQDHDGFVVECQHGRALGFDGKTLIHPSQIDEANRIFAPSDEAVLEAQAVVAAFADNNNQGKAVVVVNGKMVEELHLLEAKRLIAFDAAIKKRG